MSTPEPYDLEAVYDEQIAPLMNQIITICQEHGLPLLAHFAYAHFAGETEPRLCSTSIPVPGRTPEQFRRMLALVYQPGSEIR